MVSNISLAWLILCIYGATNALRVQFYKKENYTGYLFEIGNTLSSKGEQCIEIPSSYYTLYGTYGGGSLKTDTCIIAFSSKSCTGSLSIKYLSSGPAEQILSKDVLPPLRTRSIYICDSNNGGQQLNVDLFRFVNYQDTIAASFQDICSCQNLPWDWQRAHMSVDNHGNSMMVYSEEDCSGLKKYIPAGRNPYSANIHWERDPKPMMKSFGPSHNSSYFKTHCVHLFASIFSLEFENSESSSNLTWVPNTNVEFGAQTTFRNNGTAKLSQEYSVRKKVREVFEIQVGNSITDIQTARLEPNFNLELGSKIPYVISVKLLLGLKTAFEFSQQQTKSESSKNVFEDEKEFLIRQNVEVYPCTEYTVNAFVEMVKTNQIEYKAYAKISGMLGKGNMSAKEIKEYLQGRGLTFVRDFDNFTIIASLDGQVKAEFGVKSVFVGNGRKIVDCVQECQAKN